MNNGIEDNKPMPDAEIRFADGRRYWAASESLGDFILHPVFLKYAAVCVLIYGLLDRGGADTGGLRGFEIVVLWATLGIVAIGWYALLFIVVRALMRRGMIRVIFTPIATLSLFIVTTTLTYVIVTAFKGQLTLSVADWSKEIIRDMLVILLMDIVFSQFVAPFHPFLLQRRPNGLVAASPVPGPDQGADDQTTGPQTYTAAAVDPPQTPAQVAGAAAENAGSLASLRVGNESFALEDLIYIRSEDHYLRIVTARRRVLVRGRLADAIAQLDFRHGVQVNRSTWIAFDAIEDVQDDGKGITIVTLRGGETERVALSRRIAFLAALRQRDRLSGHFPAGLGASGQAG